MPHLVHITAESDARKIRRNGIRARRVRNWITGHDRFVWAFPVLPSYTLTHQWSREMKRYGRTALATITFRLDDDEPVFARHYLDQPVAMTAAEAVGLALRLQDPRGIEVLVPRRIEAREIVRVAALPRAIGWRYYPAAKSANRYPCDCPACLPRGEVKARRYRERVPEMQERWEARDKRIKAASAPAGRRT